MRVEPHPFFRRDGDDIRDHSPGAHRRSRAGHQDRSAHHRRPRAAEDSAGHQNGQKFRLREKGVRIQRAHGTRGDQIVEVAIAGAGWCSDERTKELLREYATLHPDDPRAEIWSKV